MGWRRAPAARLALGPPEHRNPNPNPNPNPKPHPHPNPNQVFLSIGCFVACYDLSGALAQAAAESGVTTVAGHLTSVDLPLLVCAVATFLSNPNP